MAANIQTRVAGFGIGFWAALIIGLVAIIMGVMGMMSKEQAMLILAVCAIRL